MSTAFDSTASMPLSPFGGGTMMGATAAIKQGDMVFQRYELRKVLGVGGMGVVWLAKDTKLDQEVALKFVPEALQHDPDTINDLKVQTKLGLKLTHNNIVRVLGFEDNERLAAIAMEYVDGATLAAMRVDQPAQVFEADSLHVYLLHILQALEYAHDQEKIVHRDLKPANVMVNSEDRVKVADFGIACSLRNSVGRVMSMPQRAGSGTLNYMSPQQLLGAPASVADDIYSLGATVFELMTGTPPFHSGDVQMQIREIPAPSMTQRRRDNGIEGEPIPAPWEDVIAASLSKDISLRPTNVGEFRKGLMGQPFRRGTGTGNPATAATMHMAMPYQAAAAPVVAAPPKKAALSLPILVASLASVAVVGAGLVFLSGPKVEETKKTTEKTESKLDVQRYIEQDQRALTFEKSEVSASSKRDKWDRLLSELRMQDYQGDTRMREIARHAEDRSDYWKEKEDSEKQDYVWKVQSLRSAVETARKESESKDLGAKAKAASWHDIVLKNASTLALADQGKEHVALLEEAKKQAADWDVKAGTETPATPPAEQVVYALSPAAMWGAEGKKKLMQSVQSSLTQRGHPTGTTDGAWGASTFYALVSWQQEEKLPASGVLDLPTLSRLGLQTMQEPQKIVQQTITVPARSSSPSGNSGGNSSGGGSRSGGTSWEDVAKMRVLQGGGPPMGGPPMFRP